MCFWGAGHTCTLAPLGVQKGPPSPVADGALRRQLLSCRLQGWQLLSCPVLLSGGTCTKKQARHLRCPTAAGGSNVAASHRMLHAGVLDTLLLIPHLLDELLQLQHPLQAQQRHRQLAPCEDESAAVPPRTS